jgi:hypothetical protein
MNGGALRFANLLHLRGIYPTPQMDVFWQDILLSRRGDSRIARSCAAFEKKEFCEVKFFGRRQTEHSYQHEMKSPARTYGCEVSKKSFLSLL